MQYWAWLALGVAGERHEQRSQSDDQTENDALGEVFHAAPADINVAQLTRLDEEERLYCIARRFGPARWLIFSCRLAKIKIQ
ncbi:MAG TPA: hypothetical protein PLL45_01550 [Thermoflexales bacterium]|nr:hypothetical protein [Thermoflexales bacterium]